MSSNKPQKDQRGEGCWGYVRVVGVGVGVVVCELEAKQGTLAELSLQGI